MCKQVQACIAAVVFASAFSFMASKGRSSTYVRCGHRLSGEDVLVASMSESKLESIDEASGSHRSREESFLCIGIHMHCSRGQCCGMLVVADRSDIKNTARPSTIGSLREKHPAAGSLLRPLEKLEQSAALMLPHFLCRGRERIA